MEHTVCVRGMHCKACEIRVEDAVGKIPGIRSVRVNHRKGTVSVSCDADFHEFGEIERTVREFWYEIGQERLPWFHNDPEEYFSLVNAGIVAGLLSAGFLLIEKSLPTEFGNGTFDIAWFPTVIGLVAGFSSCIAVAGGISLALAGNWQKNHPESRTWSEKLRPLGSFNLGRIIGYATLGALLGMAGSAFRLHPIGEIGLKWLAVLFMLLVGLQLWDVSPKTKSISIGLPKWLGRKIIRQSSGGLWTIAGVWAATFFLPCWFTLAMQLQAMSSGNALQWSWIMATFAIGSSLGLLTIGSAFSANFGSATRFAERTVGALSLILAIFSFGSLLSQYDAYANAQKFASKPVTVATETQTIRMVQDGSGYRPKTLYVQAGKRVKWIIESTNPYTCASQLVAPSIGLNRSLGKGTNVIEFDIPDGAMEIPFSCSMDMFNGTIVVNH